MSDGVMATFERHPTKFPGVYFRWGTHRGTGKPERIFYIAYWRGGKKIEEKTGREKQDDMTAARAAALRAKKIEGEPSRKERREADKAAKEATAGRWTFNRLFDAYTESRGEYPRRVTDEGNYRKHLRDAIGDKEPSTLSPFEADKIRLTMLKTYRPGTVNAVLGFLVRLASFGVKRRLCAGIPFPVDRPRDGAVKTESMTEEQMTAYMKAATAQETGVVGTFLAFELLTGMRMNEVRNLMWSAVDLENGGVHIRNPKGGRDQFIPLNDAARGILRHLPRDPENPFVFQGEMDKKGTEGRGKRPKSGRIGISTAQRYGREIAKAAGLPDGFRPNHGLRHTFASHLASSGEVDLYTLQRLLTHKSPIMTQRYAHLRDEALRRGANVMSRIVTDAQAKAAGEDS